MPRCHHSQSGNLVGHLGFIVIYSGPRHILYCSTITQNQPEREILHTNSRWVQNQRGDRWPAWHHPPQDDLSLTDASRAHFAPWELPSRHHQRHPRDHLLLRPNPPPISAFKPFPHLSKNLKVPLLFFLLPSPIDANPHHHQSPPSSHPSPHPTTQ